MGRQALADGNCQWPLFGNAICVAPEAVLSDGQFQVVIFGDLSLWDYLKNLGKLKKGIKIEHPEVIYRVAREIHLHSGTPCGIEADGEYIGTLPAFIELLPGALRFLLPNKHVAPSATSGQ